MVVLFQGRRGGLDLTAEYPACASSMASACRLVLPGCDAGLASPQSEQVGFGI